VSSPFSDPILPARQLQRLAYRYVVTVRIAYIRPRRLKTGYASYVEIGSRGASGSLVRIRSELYLLTAWHVLAEFRKLYDSGKHVELVIERELIEDATTIQVPGLDIGLVRIPAKNAAGLTSLVTEMPEGWEAERVRVDDGVIVVGFPSALRFDQDGNLWHGDASFLASVRTEGPNFFTIRNDPQEVVDAGWGPESLMELFLGGMSGCPAFVIRDLNYPLAGVLSEASEEFGKIVFCSLESLERFVP
jgi:hypothetical protein